MAEKAVGWFCFSNSIVNVVMACPRCQIQTHGTRLCNHCFKTHQKSRTPGATCIVVDRTLSWRTFRKNDPAYQGFQTRNGTQDTRVDLSHSNRAGQSACPRTKPRLLPVWLFRNLRAKPVSGRFLVGSGLLIFLAGQLVSTWAFMTSHFGALCTGNLLSMSGVAFALLFACNSIDMHRPRATQPAETETKKVGSSCTPVSQECS